MLEIIEKNDEDDSVTIQLKGQLTLETVGELHQILLSLFEREVKVIQLDINLLETIDFFGSQLLCSAHQFSIVKKIKLMWLDERPEHLTSLMQLSGFSRHCGCIRCPPNIECMWI